MNIMVMVVEGKNDSSDYVTIEAFDNQKDAVDFVAKINIKTTSKYWKTASIIKAGEKMEINDDFNPNN